MSNSAIKGILVSDRLGVIDLPTQISKGIGFVVVRATYGNKGVDTQYEINKNACERNHIPYGIAHSFSATLDPKKQAIHFAKFVEGDLYPVMLFEDHGGLSKNALGNNAEKFVHAFLEAFEEDVILMTYTSAPFFNKYMPLTNTFWKLPLFILSISKPSPVIPAEWSNHGKTWKYWGYDMTSQRGVAAYYNGDKESFKKSFGVYPAAGTPLPPPDELPNVVMTTSGLNIRSGPGSEYSIVGSVPSGFEIHVTGQSKAKDGKIWYVSGTSYFASWLVTTI